VRLTARIASVIRSVFGNRDLRRIELAFVAFNAAEWGVWIAMLVYAYGRGGATEAGIVAVVQLAPAAVFAPVAAGLGDRFPPARVLAFAYAVQAVSLGATGAALLAGAPAPLSYALAAVAATAVTLTRPAQAALVPALARVPDELTAANVVSGWIESVSLVGAPAATGVLLSVGSPGVVFAAMAGVSVLGGLVVLPVKGPPAAASGREATPLRALRLVREEPEARLLLGLLAAESVAIGALDVVYVVLAVSLLGLGGSGAGYLNAAFGAGGVLGIAATAALVGRRRLTPALAAGALAWGVAFVALGADPRTATAFTLLVVAGAGRIVVDVAGRTLLQRIAPVDLLARVFGLLEGLSMAALAAGSLLTPLLVALAGGRAAVIGVGAVLPAALLLAGARLLAIDRRATVPVVELSLLRSLPLFAPLGPPELESLARELQPLEARAGEEVVREDEPGERFYVIADGELEVSAGGRPLRVLRRGDSFGEIALLRSVPRTATVKALTPSRLYALGRGAFLAAVGAHADVGAEAERVMGERLAAGQATIAP
jgi:cyclic nucleotide-binding protein/MFS transporter